MSGKIFSSCILFFTILFFHSHSTFAVEIVDGAFNTGSILRQGRIYALAAQSDGKTLVGGNFSTVNADSSANIVRLNADGSVDATFNVGSGLNGSVNDLEIAADGKIYISGSFTLFNGAAVSRLIRLNANGSLDNTFLPAFNTTVNAIALSSDGSVYAAGNFTNVNGQTINRIVKLTQTGAVDANFNSGSGANSQVQDVAVQADGKIIIGGFFSTYNGVAQRFTARLNPNGSIDSTFGQLFQFYDEVDILRILIQPDGKVLFGGRFFSSSSGQPISPIIRSNANGTQDTTFQILFWQSLETTAYGIYLQPDGKILLGGSFDDPQVPSPPNIIRLNANGSSDSSFITDASRPNLDVNAITVNSAGKIVIGGDFYYVGNSTANFVTVQGLNPNGEIDPAFRALMKSPGIINDISVQTDGKVLIAGDFFEIDGVKQLFVARLNANGSRDVSFDQNLDSRIFRINSVKIQPNGKILIGGLFRRIGLEARRNFARLNANGADDGLFALPNNEIYDIELQPDGKILVGGFFDRWISSFDSYPGVIRLSENGNVDETFNPSSGLAYGFVYDIAVNGGGTIVLTGTLYQSDNAAKTVVRLDNNGSVVYTLGFIPQRGAGLALTLQNDGKAIFGGSGTIGSVARLTITGAQDSAFTPAAVNNAVWELKSQTNGKTLVGGFFSTVNGTAKQSFARLNANGSVDESFNFGTNPNGAVYAIETQPNGDIFVGGFFNQFGGANRSGIAKITNRIVRAQFDFDGDNKTDYGVFRPSNGTWYLQNSTSGFSAVNWGISTDKLAPADYDGDGKTDVAVFRDGNWYILRSSDNGVISVNFGTTSDLPVPADFTGDGRAEIAVFRPSNGVWYQLNLINNQTNTASFGSSSDKPVPADYDGDGKTDLAVFRDGIWYVQQSSQGFTSVNFGAFSDKPVPADYDGDGKVDFGVYRDGTWYLLRSQTGFTALSFGNSEDKPVAGDYDGDGKTDVAVWRAATGAFYVLRSNGNQFGAFGFGQNGDFPVASAYVP